MTVETASVEPMLAYFEALRRMPHDEWCATKLDRLPECSCIRRHVVALTNVAEAAHALVGVTSHVNVTGPAYAERKLYYASVRRELDALKDVR